MFGDNVYKYDKKVAILETKMEKSLDPTNNIKQV